MRILITGASGFLGGLLTRALLHARAFDGRPITSLLLADRAAHPSAPALADPLVECVQGDLTDRLDELFVRPVDAVFHLAAAVSAQCEADFELGMHANVDTTRALLDAARTQQAAGGPVARLVFSSSLAVYGSDPAAPLPPVVSEATVPSPRSSYGTQKLVCEHLIADYTRRGYVDGRVARLMTVAVRPGPPNAAASGFLSAIVREPLAGRSATCPVDPATRVALASPHGTVQGLLRLAQAERGTGRGRLNGLAPVNLPALSVTVAEMLTTLRDMAGDDAVGLVTFAPDPAVEAIVGSWPAAFDHHRAATLGLHPDPGFRSLVERYVADRASSAPL
ncbi:D-erythronate dehydrogenase [Streptomyces sp. NPDC015171]|uniref:D-erythronate dehydrogenase n=1 Tax=Streptomyces sp. NPDC015171 TaxID=3364945 RepID=UPI0037007FE0